MTWFRHCHTPPYTGDLRDRLRIVPKSIPSHPILISYPTIYGYFRPLWRISRSRAFCKTNRPISEYISSQYLSFDSVILQPRICGKVVSRTAHAVIILFTFLNYAEGDQCTSAPTYMVTISIYKNAALVALRLKDGLPGLSYDWKRKGRREFSSTCP